MVRAFLPTDHALRAAKYRLAFSPCRVARQPNRIAVSTCLLDLKVSAISRAAFKNISVNAGASRGMAPGLRVPRMMLPRLFTSVAWICVVTDLKVDVANG